MENNGTHCLHPELNPLQNPGHRQRINIILKELTKSNEDIRALFNITNQLATQVQVQNIVLHLRAMLANLRDC